MLLPLSAVCSFYSLVMFHVVDVPQIVSCSPMEDHLGCYQFGAIMLEQVFVQVLYRFLSKYKSNVFNLWNKCVGVQVLDHTVVISASLVTQPAESACSAGDMGPIPGLGRSPGGGLGNPLQYSCLENPVDRGTWQATVQGVAKSWT